MSARWEQSVEDWYNTSRTSGLEYLDLAEDPKPNHKQLAHNLAVIFDKISLGNRIHIKNQKIIQEHLILYNQKLSQLESTIDKLQENIKRLEKEKPLTKRDIEDLLFKISEQPKFIEKQTKSLLEEVTKKVDKLEHLVKEVERNILG
nr:P1 [Andraeanum bacilliform virus]